VERLTPQLSNTVHEYTLVRLLGSTRNTSVVAVVGDRASRAKVAEEVEVQPAMRSLS